MLLLGAITFAVLLFQGVPARATAEGSLDQPLKKQVKILGPSPYYPSGRETKKLSCFFYREVLVKQYDEGQKGAEWLSFLRVEREQPKRCELAHDADEHVIDDWREWRGYFMGVKDRLVFFSASDGENGGMPFAIFDSNTGKKIFEDSAYQSSMWTKKPEYSRFNNLRVYRRADGQTTLKYLRVVGTECDLHLEASKCWAQVRTDFSIKQSETPVCSGYENISARYSSSVAFPVETVLFPNPVTKTIDGPIKCWPVD